MNTIEERLHDALATVGQSLRPEDVPSLELPPRRGFAVPRFTAVAIAGVLAVVTVGTVFVLRPGHSEPVRPPGFAGSAETRIADVSIVLCTRTSSNPTCHASEVTAQQLSSLKERLTAMPQVRVVWYESKAEAYQSFKQHFADRPTPREGDISPSLRVDLVRQGDFDKVVQALMGRPGVDQIVRSRTSQ